MVYIGFQETWEKSLIAIWNFKQLLTLNQPGSRKYYRRKKNWSENEKTANIEKAVTFFLEEIEQKF
jgi:hypothetical protein